MKIFKITLIDENAKRQYSMLKEANYSIEIEADHEKEARQQAAKQYSDSVMVMAPEHPGARTPSPPGEVWFSPKFSSCEEVSG